MKKNLLFSTLLTVLFAALTFTSCGSSAGLGKHKQKSPAQEFAESKTRTTLRGWGQYNGFSDQNLEAFAATQARADLVKEIKTYVATLIDIYDGAYKLGSLSNEETGRVRDDRGLDESKIVEFAEATLVGSHVVMSDRYVQKDGTETCYTAVEISLDAIANYMKQNKKFNEAISKDLKEEIRYDSDKFRESMSQAFEELKSSNR